MSRWHERGCRSPDVALLDNLPFCNYCFAVALYDSVSHHHTLPTNSIRKLQNQAQMNLKWPSIVHYRNAEPPSDDCNIDRWAVQAGLSSSPCTDSQCHDGDALKPWNETALFPRIISDSQIRLLRVAAGQPREPIHIHVAVACPTSSLCPPYDILSYTKADDFEDNAERSPIFVGRYWDVIYVPPSFEDALRSIRHTESNCTIWVDFLCINQEDIDEKTQQVGLVHKIVTSASRTLIYPGHLSADTGLALDLIESVSPTSGHRATKDKKSRTALQSLFQRLYFSRIWAVQEVLLAKRLEIMYEERVVTWPEMQSSCDFIDTQVASWLLWRCLSHGTNGQGLIHLLLDTSHCQCSDPRDKVFGILGLFTKENFVPDYRLSVESIYIGVASYLVSNCHAFEIFALNTTGKRTLCIPSWVPDWSHPVVLKLPELEDEVDMSNDAVKVASPFVFINATDSYSDCSVDANTGSLQIRASKLCSVTGEIVKVLDQTRVIMDRGRRGTLVLSVPNGEYRIGSDFVFLLNGWDHPIILRHHTSTNSYTVVSVCAIAIGPPLPGTPWSLPSAHPSLFQGITRVSKPTQGENDLLLAWHSNLSILCEQEIAVPCLPPVTEAVVLDFSLLSLTGLSEVESRLRDIWNHLEQQLGWMFLDQVAVWQFLRDMDTTNREDLFGKASMPSYEVQVEMCDRFCGLTIPSTYQWNVCQFCWSFIRNPISPLALSQSNWTPMLVKLKSQISEVRKWAEVTEQLLTVFESSRLILQRTWPSFPGTELPKRWGYNWTCFQEALESDLGKGQAFHPDYLWDWSEFKTTLSFRERLQEQKIPPQLDPSVNINMAVRLGLRSLGLELGRQDPVQIS